MKGKENPYVGIKLKDLLASAKDDAGIHLGSGTNFLFCGYVKELRDCLEELDEVNLARTRRTIRKNNGTINGWESLDISYMSYCERERLSEVRGKHAADYSTEAWLAWIDDKRKRMEWAISSNEKQYARLKRYKPLAERLTKGVRLSLLEPDTMVVKIEGYENGQYWTKNDYKERSHEKDKNAEI